MLRPLLRTMNTVSNVKVMSSSESMAKSAFSCAFSSVSSGRSSPRSALSMPPRMSRKPLPPASTTPAFLRTGFMSVVCASVISPWAMACSSTYSTLFCSSAALAARSAARRETVRIVPSAGFITALYAAATPSCIAAAKAAPSASLQPLSSLEMPRKRRDRMTPELPRAPRSSAEAVTEAA